MPSRHRRPGPVCLEHAVWLAREFRPRAASRRTSPLSDHLVNTQIAEFSLRDAKIAEDCFRIAAERRWGAAYAAGRFGQLDRYADEVESADRLVLDADDHVSRIQLGIREDLRKVTD